MPLDRDLADWLAAVREIDRPFHLCFEGPILRRGDKRVSRKRRERREAELRPAMEGEMRERSRRPFRGPVSVTITIFAREPNTPTSVKAYLDCMTGIFYEDDRAVEHLYVRVFSQSKDEAEEKVYIEIEPLKMYIKNFDHAYARLGIPFGGEGHLELERDFERDELAELEGEGVRDGRRGWGVLDAVDPELAQHDREYRSMRISELRLKELLAGHLRPHDRPGASSIGLSQEEADGSSGWVERELPGALWLPLPGVSGWRDHVEAELAGHMDRWRIKAVPISYSLGLDLAVQGHRNGGKDLDNLAHVVIGSFRRILGNAEAEPVTSYRVYNRTGPRTGIRAQVVDARLLEVVAREVFESRFKRLEVDPD
jgi:hypothetical protein